MCNEIVVKVHMHCEGCKDKVSKCLRGFDGVQDVMIDSVNHKVVIKGKKIDPLKVLERLRKKYSRNVELISPKFFKLENKEKKDEGKKEDKAQLKIVVLKVNMHCQGCAYDIKNDLERMRGIMTVEPNMENSRVTVRGIVDAPKLVEYIKKRLGRHAEILDQETETCNCCKDLVMWENKWECISPSSAQCICLSHMFSDENPLSCSIM
ncbi:hypothetical protein L484_017465 [Morus notabilis]|uniref:HMA domain-containing protein n=1 Tax=Morus notabilis TaxID=981085 RepID=W9QW87_9ROSA|nr:hypothetical protein L484_017465 [Morus notabilis]